MPIIIQQKPHYKTLPIGQDIIFTVSDDGIVANQVRVKFIAEVYVSNDSSNIMDPESLVATLKTTPNNAGVGIFNLRSILESYVSADNLPRVESTSVPTYKGIDYSENKEFPIHLIDKYSTARNAVRFCQVVFRREWLINNVVIINPSGWASYRYFIFNGYISHEETLDAFSGDYGYNLYTQPERAYIQRNYNSRFLTNAPTTQYAQLTDYGTVAMFNMLYVSDYSFQTSPSAALNAIYKVVIKLYNSADVLLGSWIEVDNKSSLINREGGWNQATSKANNRFLYFGCYPANLSGYGVSSGWATHKANVSYYTVQAFKDNDAAVPITQEYTINIISECDYEPIRLTWLNKLGAWDYYTFMKKSVRSIKTKGVTYTQLGGTWNESKFKIYGHKGGKKSFRVNAKESIKINTDFVTEQDAVWFEELINSPEVYILNGYSEDEYETFLSSSGFTNKYVHPVLLTTSSYIRKTRANDRLIQYTFEIERNKDNRTQTS